MDSKIVGLDGKPLLSRLEEETQKKAEATVASSIEKLKTFSIPAILQKSITFLKNKKFGYMIIVFNKDKTASIVESNISGASAGRLIAHTIDEHYKQGTANKITHDKNETL